MSFAALNSSENFPSCPSTLVGPLVKITIDEIRQACKKHPLACGFNPNENVYEPLKLMQTVMGKVNDICLRYLDNAQLDTLPCPSTLKPPKVSICASRNTRRRMEDRHVVIHDIHSMFNIPDTSPASYYAIFDGHAGSDAAAYSAAHLHQYLVESTAYPTEPEQALKEAFLRTDECFLEKSRIENFRSGTTAVCALLCPKQETLYVAWVGDSQALLVNRGKVLQIVKPHKPCREDEKDRIEANGGCVMFWGMWRVNGQLAVSRAIGDLKLKPYVTAEPDIVAVPLDGNEEFLIMACDGLWDFVSEDDAAIAVYKRIKEDPENIDSVAESLSDLAKQEGSRDNISIIIIFLKDPIKIAKNISSDCSWLSQKQSNEVTMETGVDNTLNNTASNNFDLFDVFQKRSNLDRFNDEPDFKANGNEANKDNLFLFNPPANGKRPADFDDDDLGPETDIDAVDDKIEKNEKMEILDHSDLEVQRAQSSEFEPIRELREETPTPPADSVLDSSGITDNVAESEDSEDEWNYYKVDQKETETLPSNISNKVSSPVSCPDEMSQLNPDAKEFVPVSPTRVTGSPSPFPRDLGDELIAQSPRRAVPMDISVPSPIEFQSEVKQRPSELFDEFENQKTEQQNGHQLSSQEIMQNLLNGKDVSEIEFHPQNFTPTELIENTKENISPAEDNPTNSSLSPAQDVQDFASFIPKDQDPMSMSFYQDKGEDTQFSTNPFDLNKVQLIPDNIDDFIQPTNENKDNITSANEEKEHISPVESPLGVPLSPELPEVQEVHKEDEISLVELANSADILESPKSPVMERMESPRSPVDETVEFVETMDTGCNPIQELIKCRRSPVKETMESPRSPVMETMESPRSPVMETMENPRSPVTEVAESPIMNKSPVPESSQSPIMEAPQVCEINRSPCMEKSPSPNPVEVQPSPIESPVREMAKSPLMESNVSPHMETNLCEIEVPETPVLERPESPRSPKAVEIIITGKTPTEVLESAIFPFPETKSPVLQVQTPVENSPIGPLSPKSPIPELTGLVSPDITASIKDDNISGEDAIKSPIMEEIHSPFVLTVQENPVEQIMETQKMEECLNSNVEESKVHELISDAIQDIIETEDLEKPETQDFSNQITFADLQNISSVTTVESVPSQSPLPEIQSPLSPPEESPLSPPEESPLSPPEEVEKFQTEAPESWKENLEIKCEIIKPEFAVPTIASPCDESKGADTPPPTPSVTEPQPPELITTPVPEPQKIIEKLQEKPTKTASKVLPKKTSSPTKPSPKTTTTPTVKRATPASNKPLTPSSTLRKTTTTPSPRVSTARTTPKMDKKPSEKPLTNGTTKPQVKTTSLMKNTTTTSAKPSTLPAKTAPKPLSTRPASTTVARPPAPKTTTTARPLSATTKPKPSGVPPKTTAAPPRAAPRTSAPATTKPLPTTLKPKPSTTSSTTKPRITTTHPSKPLSEKQIKESANKQISATKTAASRTTTARTATTVKKTEPKSSVASTRTTTTRTTTTRPLSKKPSDVTKTTTTVTKTKTIASKPQQNGVVSVIQDITTSTTIEEPSMVKDISPTTEIDINQLVEI